MMLEKIEEKDSVLVRDAGFFGPVLAIVLVAMSGIYISVGLTLGYRMSGLHIVVLCVAPLLGFCQFALTKTADIKRKAVVYLAQLALLVYFAYDLSVVLRIEDPEIKKDMLLSVGFVCVFLLVSSTTLFFNASTVDSDNHQHVRIKVVAFMILMLNGVTLVLQIAFLSSSIIWWVLMLGGAASTTYTVYSLVVVPSRKLCVIVQSVMAVCFGLCMIATVALGKFTHMDIATVIMLAASASTIVLAADAKVLSRPDVSDLVSDVLAGIR